MDKLPGVTVVDITEFDLDKHIQACDYHSFSISVEEADVNEIVTRMKEQGLSHFLLHCFKQPVAATGIFMGIGDANYEIVKKIPPPIRPLMAKDIWDRFMREDEEKGEEELKKE